MSSRFGEANPEKLKAIMGSMKKSKEEKGPTFGAPEDKDLFKKSPEVAVGVVAGTPLEPEIVEEAKVEKPKPKPKTEIEKVAENIDQKFEEEKIVKKDKLDDRFRQADKIMEQAWKALKAGNKEEFSTHDLAMTNGIPKR